MTPNSRPNQQELAFFANLLRDAPANHDAPPPFDKTALLDRLDYHGVTLLAHRAGRLPATLTESLQQRRSMMAANDALKQNALKELYSALVNAGLHEAILFKGGALAYSIYPQPWLRPRTDNDVLINKLNYAQFERVFHALGYQKLFAIEGHYISYQCTFSKPLAGKSVMNIDLHWRINNRQSLAKAFSVKELLTNGAPLNTLSPNIMIPSHIDSILIACLHRLGHHHNEERLVWLYDIHLLASKLTPSDWALLAARAINKQIASVTLDALQLCQQLLGTTVDDDAIKQLDNGAQQHELSRIFLQRDLPEWRYFLCDLKALPSWRQKFGLVYENLFPSRAYIRQQMGTRSAVLGYTKRLLRGARRIIIPG